MKVLSSLKIQLILFLAAFSCYLAIAGRDGKFLFGVVIAVVSAVLIDILLHYFEPEKPLGMESVVITGFIIGIVLSGRQPIWPFLAAVAAISSKYFVRFEGRHIFNPAAFGIFISMNLFGAATQWRGTYAWYILVPAGLYFAFRFRKLELLSGYFLVSCALFGAQAFAQKINLLHIFGYLSYFFIFVMLIEPRTTPVKATGKFIFGALVAGLVFIFTEAGVTFDAELAALLLFNIFVPRLNKIPERRK